MMYFDRKEAVLLRILGSFFGKDRVVPQMSIMAVLGGDLPSAEQNVKANEFPEEAAEWARERKCLFTILNESDEPRLVIEFVADFDKTIDVELLQKHQYMRPLLEAAGVLFLTVSADEFSSLIDPRKDYDVMAFLKEKVDIEELSQKSRA